MLPNWLFMASLIGLIVLFAVGTSVQVTIRRRLNRYYANNPNAPDVTFNPLEHSANRTLTFLRFIAQKQYVNLHDSKLTRDCNALRVLYMCYLVVLVWVAFAILVRS
jgi:H+/Cl- antiporter ClcA